ncbi:hypothetical protein VT06_09755 [Arsukibacterium sp. MJ3]|uniref:NAD(P)/FAD-dependent oxidoreductase n=1 Tax=Arsukibacterium sp. MJ3 TaxID=1632859 RepID=UPI00062740F3|nr:NAD(P)-binding protein [Arsukibacterium sp. MJ3]KKO48790.1 hypothetical protein VT06_09755 [Arsukibacterium sp. MJ3]
MPIAVIGAGMAGAAAARTLVNVGLKVEVFDKGRSVGGRMSSKRTEHGYLDLGAQYFTARSERFSQQVSRWLASGVVNYWPANCYRFEQATLSLSTDKTARFVGSPAMQEPVKALLAAIPTHLNCRISRLNYLANAADSSVNNSKTGWYLYDDQQQRFGPYQALIITLPPVQLHALLLTVNQVDLPDASVLQQITTELQQQALLPCWAVNLQLAQPLNTAADAVFVKEGNLSWLARQHSKPGRVSESDNWLVHFSPQCSALHINVEPEQITALAKAELELIFEQPVTVVSALPHRWLYAQINSAITQQVLPACPELKLAFAGDWLLGGRVENAWLSGVAAATEVMTNDR